MKKNNLSTEEKIVELERQVAWFDSEEFVLDQAIERYKAAEKLSTEITAELQEFKSTITQIGDKQR